MSEPSLTKEQLATIRKALRDFEDRTVDALNITPREIGQLIAAAEERSVTWEWAVGVKDSQILDLLKHVDAMRAENELVRVALGAATQQEALEIAEGIRADKERLSLRLLANDFPPLPEIKPIATELKKL